MSSSRRPIYINLAAAELSCPAIYDSGLNAFHRSLPNYSPTPLIPLPTLAAELGLRGVYIKDESNRLGLPSFKILGASWGLFRALSKKLSLSSDVSLEELSTAARKVPVKLFAATDGNHGRAVAFMANMLSLQADILVPQTLDEYTRGLIASEGACVHVVGGDYDLAVQKAAEMATATHGGLLIQDTSFPGYEEIPSWIVEGYSTMLSEVDAQLANLGLRSTVVITPVGVGSLAHAVARHCKSANRSTLVVTVEPDTAPCLHQSLISGLPVSIKPSRTIMSGMECGTVSLSAWSDLQNLVDASTTVSCFESHCAVQYLLSQGIASGPCGAASLAALRLLASTNRSTLKLDEGAVVVLLSTEGVRPYRTPMDVSIDDPIALAQILATVNPPEPSPSSSDEAWESDIADYITAWFEHRGIENHRLETLPSRPSVVRVVHGSGSSKSFILAGHSDTVRFASDDYERSWGDLSEDEDRLVIKGRGSLDMNASLAAAMTSILNASTC